MNEIERHTPPLAVLKVDVAPGRDLWAGIATRLADADEREHVELTGDLGAALRALRRDLAPPQDGWAAVAERLADPTLRDRCELPPAVLAALRAQPREAAPLQDLWAGIAARIDGRAPRRRRTPWLAAAASVAASLLVVIGLQLAPERALETTAARTPLRPSAEVFAATIGNAGGDREDAAALQRASFRSISPESRALVRANLKIVNSAEAQIEKAMTDDPDDAAYLQSLLDSARQQQQGLRAALAERP